jgi:hypothetical protein
MLSHLNRQQRRHAAKRFAPELARSFLQVSIPADRGRPVMPVHGEKAVRVLTRALAQLIQTAQPHCMRLTPDEAMGFPGQDPEALQGGEPWLAVGIDRDGRATYALRYVAPQTGDRMAVRRLVEHFMFRELAVLCAASGLGAGMVEGAEGFVGPSTG